MYQVIWGLCVNSEIRDKVFIFIFITWSWLWNHQVQGEAHLYEKCHVTGKTKAIPANKQCFSYDGRLPPNSDLVEQHQ